MPAKPLNNAQISGPFYFCFYMKSPYIKRFTCPKDLVSLLKSRGLIVFNEQEAVEYIKNIGYYRLSAYCYPLLKVPKYDHIYKSNASFDLVMSMYLFDKKLRLLLFDEIEKSEVAIRSAMSNLITDEINNIFWITDVGNFYDSTLFSKTVCLIQAEIDKSTQNHSFAHQHKFLYDGGNSVTFDINDGSSTIAFLKQFLHVLILQKLQSGRDKITVRFSVD